jgi:hypothetical protein
MADTEDLKSSGVKTPCGFESRPRHQKPITPIHFRSGRKNARSVSGARREIVQICTDEALTGEKKPPFSSKMLEMEQTDELFRQSRCALTLYVKRTKISDDQELSMLRYESSVPAKELPALPSHRASSTS